MTGPEAEGEREERGVGFGRLLRLVLLASLFLALVWYTLRLVKEKATSGPAYQVAPVARTVAGPEWLTREARRDLAGAIERELGGEPFPVHDRQRLASLCRRLCALGLAVRAVGEAHLPAQVKLTLELRRPCATFRRGDRVHLVDGAGKRVRLPLQGMAAGLPEITWTDVRPPAWIGADLEAGAGVAHEVRTRFLPQIRRWIDLRLVSVDVSNLDYRVVMASDYAQVRIWLATPEGGRIRCEWGHPPGSNMVRIPLRDKVSVARQLLARYPGFKGVEAVDLRYPNSPETWVRRR